MSKEPMVDAFMTLGPKSDARMIVEQLERIALALERIVEMQRKPNLSRRGHHMSTDKDGDDRILSFWGP